MNQVNKGMFSNSRPVSFLLTDTEFPQSIDGAKMKQLQKNTLTFLLSDGIALVDRKDEVSGTSKNFIPIPATTNAMLVYADQSTGYCTIRFLDKTASPEKEATLKTFAATHKNNVKLLQKETGVIKSSVPASRISKAVKSPVNDANHPKSTGANSALLVDCPSASDTLFYTGSMQTYQIPAGVTNITIQAFGAAGANGNAGGNTLGGNGGKGSKVTGNLTVTGGSTLNIFVGGAASGVTGGYNGGAAGGSSLAGGGGGASDVRYPGTGSGDRIIVAGGGGGGRGGCENSAAVGGNGGSGDEDGVDGSDSPTHNGFAGGGKGGTSLAGGSKGIGCGGFLGVD
ncbi:MAG: hypothetical protein LW630_09500, partial [Saprospiraceae bacterium]|nr:hypothetical protein [Saprospiraceae bacterium]